MAQGDTAPRKDLLDRLALQPRGAPRIQSRDLRSLHTGHVALHGVADTGLQIREVTVARWELLEESSVQHRRRAWCDRVHAVLLIDRLAQHDAPAALAL